MHPCKPALLAAGSDVGQGSVDFNEQGSTYAFSGASLVAFDRGDFGIQISELLPLRCGEFRLCRACYRRCDRGCLKDRCGWSVICTFEGDYGEHCYGDAGGLTRCSPAMRQPLHGP